MLEVKNLSVHYGMIQAVRNVDFKVNEGEIVSLIGANGAGKSTILKTLSGLIHPSEGEIVYLGENIASTSAKKIVEKGLVQVPEGRHVFPGLTVKENLELGAFLRKDKEAIQKDMEDVFERFPILKERKDQDAQTLSGGEQQRVGIVRAMIAEPMTLLMDEPFSALDAISRKQLQELTKLLHHEFKMTTIFVTHDTDEALKLADRIAVLKDGEIQQVASPSEILASPATAFVAELFKGGVRHE